MPIYANISARIAIPKFEKLVRRAAEVADVDCPSCGQKHVSRQYSTFAAHANGLTASQPQGPACPGGMCRNPGVCGMN